MAYSAVYLESVEEDLKKLDKATVRKILTRIEKYLVKAPKDLGKPLKGDFEGYWRYRWGDYRIIYKISEKELLILVLSVGNRKNIYN